MALEWYIIHVFSGSEEFVVKALEEKIIKYKMQDQVADIVIPKENVIEIKDGRKVVSEKRSFPGYILVKMEMNDKNWYFVRNTPKVTGFVGAGKKPKPLSKKEVSHLKREWLGQLHISVNPVVKMWKKLKMVVILFSPLK